MVCFRVSPSKRSGRLRCKECSTVPPDRTRQAPIQHLPYLDKTNHIGYTLTPALASCAGRRKVGKGEAGTFTDIPRRFARAVGAAGARHGARTVRQAVFTPSPDQRGPDLRQPACGTWPKASRARAHGSIGRCIPGQGARIAAGSRCIRRALPVAIARMPPQGLIWAQVWMVPRAVGAAHGTPGRGCRSRPRRRPEAANRSERPRARSGTSTLRPRDLFLRYRCAALARGSQRVSMALSSGFAAGCPGVPVRNCRPARNRPSGGR